MNCLVIFIGFKPNLEEILMIPKPLVNMIVIISVLFMNSFALPFSGSILGKWCDVDQTGYNVCAVANDDLSGTADFNWGIPATTKFDNEFSFDGYSFTDVEENTPFALGNFSYRNGSTYFSSGINGVDLSLFLTFTDPVSFNNAFDFNFQITNTPNTTGDAVQDGDIVTAMNTYTPTTFTYSGIDYTLNLLGFSSDEGTTIRTDFSSAEGAVQEAQLIAQITSDIQNVPEPGIISLLTLGLLTLGGTALTRRKK